MKQTQQGGRSEEEELRDEGLAQSLQKREQNIQENKAMVGFLPSTDALLHWFVCNQRSRDSLSLLCFSWPSSLQI